MTINEAIQHCDEVANTCKETECAAEHRQLAEWLRELVRLRKIKPLVEKIALERIGAEIDALEASVPNKDDAIPVDWLLRKAEWCDKNNGIFVSGAIRSAVDAWREE